MQFVLNIKMQKEQDATQMQTDVQYAIIITVPPDQCTKEGSDFQNVLSKEDAKNLKEKLNEKEKCLLGEEKKYTLSDNVIAIRPDLKTKEHD